MDIGGFALRDVIIVVSGLTATYLVILLLRLLQVGRHKSLADEEFVAAEAELVAPTLAPERARDDAPPSVRNPVRQPVAATPPRFGDELERSHQDMDARQLREEVGRLRAELEDLRGELGHLKATRNVSPQYADAMTMAERGLTAQDVADRCGISLGEAELIWALSRGPTNFDQEEDYGEESRPKHARAA